MAIKLVFGLMKMENQFMFTFQKKRPSANSTKLWLLSNGTFIKANPNDRRISDAVLNRIIKKLQPQALMIRNFWVAYHGYEKYYM